MRNRGAQRLAPLDMSIGGCMVSRRSRTGVTPIINPPESAVLSVARSQISPNWNDQPVTPTPSRRDGRAGTTVSSTVS